MQSDAVTFAQVFLATFNAQASKLTEPIGNLYSSKKRWTSFMLTDQEAVLRQTINAWSVAISTPLLIKPEWHKFDLLGVVDGNDVTQVRPSSSWWKSAIRVVVEHENEGSLTDEAWKLAHLRCPLKVLLLYDYNEAAKATSRSKNISAPAEQYLSDVPSRAKSGGSLLITDVRSARPEQVRY